MTDSEPNATQAAVSHAEATGVDLSTVQGSGVGGRITQPDVAAAAQAPSVVEVPVAADPSADLGAPDLHFLVAERQSLQMNRDALIASLDRAAELAEIDRQIAVIDKLLGA